MFQIFGHKLQLPSDSGRWLLSPQILDVGCSSLRSWMLIPQIPIGCSLRPVWQRTLVARPQIGHWLLVCSDSGHWLLRAQVLQMGCSAVRSMTSVALFSHRWWLLAEPSDPDIGCEPLHSLLRPQMLATGCSAIRS